MNTTSLFVFGTLLIIVGIVPWNNRKLSREFVENAHLTLISLGCIIFTIGLAWAMCI